MWRSQWLESWGQSEYWSQIFKWLWEVHCDFRKNFQLIWAVQSSSMPGEENALEFSKRLYLLKQKTYGSKAIKKIKVTEYGNHYFGVYEKHILLTPCYARELSEVMRQDPERQVSALLYTYVNPCPGSPADRVHTQPGRDGVWHLLPAPWGIRCTQQVLTAPWWDWTEEKSLPRKAEGCKGLSLLSTTLLWLRGRTACLKPRLKLLSSEWRKEVSLYCVLTMYLALQ